MDVKTLRYFVAVAQDLHYGRAAKRLNMSQPPLSRHIQKLEEELGCALLKRTKRRVELTPAGEMLLRKSVPIVESMTEAMSATKRAGRGEIGRLAVGFYIGATDTLLPAILRHYKAQAPNVELVLHDMLMAEVVSSLEARRIDVGFLRPPVANPAISVKTLVREPFVLAVPADSALARKRRIRLSDLAREPFVMPAANLSILHSQIRGACFAAGFEPIVVQEAKHTHTIIGLVRSGAGIALVPSSVQVRGGHGVEFRAITGPLPKAEVAIAWRTSDTSPIVRAFCAAAVTAAPYAFGKKAASDE
jgi:DNA-binding transcriptional LysR family regulator